MYIGFKRKLNKALDSSGNLSIVIERYVKHLELRKTDKKSRKGIVEWSTEEMKMTGQGKRRGKEESGTQQGSTGKEMSFPDRQALLPFYDLHPQAIQSPPKQTAGNPGLVHSLERSVPARNTRMEIFLHLSYTFFPLHSFFNHIYKCHFHFESFLLLLKS